MNNKIKHHSAAVSLLFPCNKTLNIFYYSLVFPCVEALKCNIVTTMKVNQCAMH